MKSWFSFLKTDEAKPEEQDVKLIQSGYTTYVADERKAVEARADVIAALKAGLLAAQKQTQQPQPAQ